MNSHYINHENFLQKLLNYREALSQNQIYELQREAWVADKLRCPTCDFWDGVDSNDTKSKLALASNELGKIFVLLAERTCRMPMMTQMAFRANIPHDVMIAEAVFICWQKENKFIPGKGKPFNFFTTTILNNSKQAYRDEMRQSKLARNYFTFLGYDVGLN